MFAADTPLESAVQDDDTETPSESPEDPPEPSETESGEEQEELDPMEALRNERDRMREQLLRTVADFENFRKRARRDLLERERRAKEDTLREILPTIDNLERAIATSKDAEQVKTVLDGVRMVLKLFEDTSERLGLVRVASVGERFDPNLHDALQQLEQSDVEPGTIVAELAAGYRLGDHLLRPAQVVVARSPQPSVSDTLTDADDVIMPEDDDEPDTDPGIEA